MLKKSTLLSIFFLLFIGLSDYGYGCHKDFPHGKDTDCNGGGGGGGGGGEDAEYSVTISGAVEGDTDPNRSWHKGNPHGIGYGSAAPHLGLLTNMDFFITANDPNEPNAGGPFTGMRGFDCFGGTSLTTDLTWRGGDIRQKRGRSEGTFYFDGCSDEGIDPDTGLCFTKLLYWLEVFGPLVDPWPPTGTTSLLMDTWEMGIANEGELRNIACIGEGSFADFNGGAEDTLFIEGTLK